jgi:hypothetical protein
MHAIVHPADIQDRDGGVLVLSTLFGMFPFLQKLFADGGYQGPQFANAVVKILPSLRLSRQAPRRRGRLHDRAQALDRRTHHRLAQSLSAPCQGLGVPQPQGARVLAPRIDSPHAQKAMQSSLNSSDRL